MGAPAGVRTPPLPPGVRAQQGPMPQTPSAQGQGGPQENPVSLIMQIGEIMRKLARALGQSKPNALITLKQAIPIFTQLLSEVAGPEQGPGAPALAAPPPTPTEVPAPPTESAAPAGGYVPGM